MFQSTLYKKFLAVFVTLVIVGGGLIGYIFLNKIPLGVTQTKDSEISDSIEKESNKAIANLKNTISNVKPENLVFQDVSLDDLQIYPKSWAEKNYKGVQLENKLISGAEADPDKDGLTNRQEFLYGSNPLKARTYCDLNDTPDDPKCPKNDKQLVDEGLNPLTGLDLEIKKKFRVKKIDRNIAENLETSFNVASDQGFDFPKLYEESRKLDLTSDLNKIQVLTQKDTGEGVLNYYKSRLDNLKEFAQDDELSSFNSVYGVVDKDKIEALRAKYQAVLETMSQTIAPELLSEYHKANIFVIQKLVNVIKNRQDILIKDKAQTEEDIKQSQTQAKEMLWAYRNLNSQQVKLQARLQRDYPTVPSSAQ
jgi:hypothetical protein